MGYSNIIDDMKDKEICAYCDGSLVVKDAKIYYLMDIHSLKKIRLPPVCDNYTLCLFNLFTNDPSSLVSFMVVSVSIFAVKQFGKILSQNWTGFRQFGWFQFWFEPIQFNFEPELDWG